ncbi:MAG: nicotinate (nicotinamide) nucleotide adenylyltransferase [Erysipelotrichaceae bacterium]
MKIGILGGSFDPIHHGHLGIAKAAKKALRLDEVWFMPAKQAAFKMGSSPFSMRCDMVALAIKPYRKFHLCTIEGDLADTSYTVDTMSVLTKRHPEHQFYFIIGEDQVEKLDKWKDIERLRTMVTFVGFTRVSETLQRDDVVMVPIENIPVSSSQIRSNQKLNYVSPSVLAYSAKHGLYLEDRLQALMSPKRFAHSKRVAELCEELAIAHGMDEEQAYLAGLLHDVCKHMPYEKSKRWITFVDASLTYAAPALWHGPLGAYFLRKEFKIHDHAILQAVRYHVQGNPNTPLNCIVYLADKLERGRGYDTSKQIALAKQNLKQAFDVVKFEQLEYLKKEIN